LKKELFSRVKKELVYILIMLVISLIIFRLAFYKEPFSATARLVLSLFWLFVLPGYFIMLYWSNELDLKERFVIGIIFAAAVMGISSYYIGLAGINIKWHTFLLPPAIIIIGLVANILKDSKAH